MKFFDESGGRSMSWATGMTATHSFYSRLGKEDNQMGFRFLPVNMQEQPSQAISTFSQSLHYIIPFPCDAYHAALRSGFWQWIGKQDDGRLPIGPIRMQINRVMLKCLPVADHVV